MLGSILNPAFVILLDGIAQHFRVQEQNHFESYNLDSPNFQNDIGKHLFLNYIDLSLAMAETHIELDFEVAVRLMKLDKYASHIGCSYGKQDFEMDYDCPDQYQSIEKFLVNYDSKHDKKYSHYKFVLWKYEYQN